MTTKKPTKAVITKETPADENHQVVTVVGGQGLYRKKPCKSCPWRRDAVGEFPAEAFRISAHTTYDMAMETFACHESGTDKPSCCAGFLLRGADHNLKIRLRLSQGTYEPDKVSDGGHDLFDNYREMAIANGVGPDDEILKPCRD
jgi:hypothetical protein